MELNDIEPKNADFQYHSGSPLPPVSYLSRTPGYRIVGKSFGDKRGKVEIEYDDSGKTLSQRLKTWSDTLIEIHFPGSDPLQWRYWNAYVTVTRADSNRPKAVTWRGWNAGSKTCGSWGAGFAATARSNAIRDRENA